MVKNRVSQPKSNTIHHSSTITFNRIDGHSKYCSTAVSLSSLSDYSMMTFNLRIMQETLIMGSPNRPVGHVSRRANGTWLDHEHHAVAQIYRRAQRITGFNLRSAEDWQV